jgi:hypothetical protein
VAEPNKQQRHERRHRHEGRKPGDAQRFAEQREALGDEPSVQQGAGVEPLGDARLAGLEQPFRG